MAHGSQPTVEAVHTWFLQALEEARTIEPLGNMRIVLLYEDHPAASDETLAGWRREASGKPQHPLRALIETEERRRRHGPDHSRETIWFLDDSHWRLSTDTVRGEGDPTPFDTAQSGGASWQLTQDYVSYFGPDRSAPSDVVNAELDVVLQRLGWILNGGLQTARHADPGTLDVTVRGEQWEARLASDKGTTWVYTGEWDSDGMRGLVRRMERRARAKNGLCLRADVSGWHLDPVVGRTIAREISIHVLSPSEVKSIVRLEGVWPERRSEILQIVAPPNALGADPVRGELRVTRVHDYRPDRGVTTHYDAATGTEVGTSSLEHLVRRDDGATRRLRVLGWVAAGVLACALGVTWIRRRARQEEIG